MSVWRASWRGRWGPWLVVLLLLFAMQVKPWWTPTRDGAAYLSIGRGLTEGRLAQQGSAHVTYPLGYPALIAPAFVIGDRPFFAISLLHLVCMGVALGGIHRWMRRHVGRGAAVLTALAVVNVSLWSFYRATLSETAFLAALVWAALLLEGGRDAPAHRHRWVAGAVVAAAAVWLRSVAVTLAGGVVLAAFLSRQDPPGAAKRSMRSVVFPVLVLLGAFVLALAVDRLTAARAGTESGGYLHLVDRPGQTLLGQFAETVRLRTAEIGRLLLPGMHKAYAPPGAWIHPVTWLYLALAAGIGVGWWRALRRRSDVLLATFPFYVAMYLVWPFDQGTRYLAPTLPILVVALWYLLRGRRLIRWRRPILAFLLVAHLGVAVGDWTRSWKLAPYDALWPRADVVAARIPDEERGRVATLGLDGYEHLIVQVALDRPVTYVRDVAGLGAELWVLSRRGGPLLSGFEAPIPIRDWRLRRRLPSDGGD